MKAVILAAGKSTRTHPLTVSHPKALLNIANKPLIEHILSQLAGTVDEAIIVIGFYGSLIKSRLGTIYKSKGRKIMLTYAVQKDQTGTANALLAAKKHLSARFLLLMGDDLYNSVDIKKCLKSRYCILGQKVQDISHYGAIIAKYNRLQDVAEKPKSHSSSLANTGLYVLDEQIFPIIEKLKKSDRKEFELTDAVRIFARENTVNVLITESWHPITYPWSLFHANELAMKARKDIRGSVEKGVTLKGKVTIGKNTLLRSGTYIEGPVVIGENCDIGPNCYIRATSSIGDNCRVGHAVEIKNSIIMDNTNIGHLTYIGDSVIGSNVNIGAGTVVANLRHDNSFVKSMVNGKLINSNRRKLGTIIGDSAKIAINTSIYPGRKIWPNKSTLPGEMVKEDIM